MKDQGSQQHGVKNDITIQGEGKPQPPSSGFQFGRMFDPSVGHPVSLRLETCEAVGTRMTAMPEPAREDSDMPAGYTYFGQFVDHDISMDLTQNEADDPSTDGVEPTPDSELEQNRSPSLDLDSLYGSLSGAASDLVNGPIFKIGTTTPANRLDAAGHSAKSLRFDLPRKDKVAVIGDPRNDENLVVAQTHLMWLKFHNEIVHLLTDKNPGAASSWLLETARDLVTRHYQHIVLHDYLPRFIDIGVYEEVIVEGKRKQLSQCCGEVPFMPLEFAVAAFRLGHSQVREEYEWNANFSTDGAILPRPSPFSLLFEFSNGSGNLGGEPTLSTTWIADFRTLYDLSGADLPHLSESKVTPLNFAKKLDPYIAPSLGDLPALRDAVASGAVPFNNLAALNLRRGAMRALPSGQDLANAMPSVRPLTEAKMRSAIDDDFADVLERFGLYERTPLWLYILLEARVHGQGDRLGKLGSIIVADTFRTLAMGSRTSIVTPGQEWRPEQAIGVLGADSPLETIADILIWVDSRTPLIDPLQDARFGAV